jgi:hypothetical protein
MPVHSGKLQVRMHRLSSCDQVLRVRPQRIEGGTKIDDTHARLLSMAGAAG